MQYVYPIKMSSISSKQTFPTDVPSIAIFVKLFKVAVC